ncbi:MAG TPA: radical SAM protein [Chloroflexota bacterium]|nr:radical SAM protein [Chloroflexota bacterium]
MPLPRELYVEVTNRCNSLCLTCPLTWGGHEAKRDLGLDDFLALVSELPTIRRVVLHGIGEPLLNRDLPRMITALKARQATVLFNSNGIALTPRRQRELIASGLDELRVSLDAARPETYARVRGVDAFARVLRNVGAMIRLEKELGVTTPKLSLWFTGLRENVAELPDLVRAAAREGIPEVHLQRLVYRGVGLAVADQAIYRAPDATIAATIAEARSLAEQLGVTLSVSGEGTKAPAGQTHVPASGLPSAPWHGCSRPWRLAYITANGNVLPCCIAPFTDVPYDSIVLGNVNQGSLAEVWNGERYREFRERHASRDNPPECCRRCGAEWSL